MEVVASVDGFRKITESVGLPPPNDQVIQRLLRGKVVPSDEQLILETSMIEAWFEECRKIDPCGRYIAKSAMKVYNGKECSVLVGWIVSFGVSRSLVEDTDVLEFVALDGGHIRNVFGGVVLVASLPTANRRVFPLMFGWAPSEDEASVSWFTTTFYETFPNFQCVWNNDQGSGISAQAVSDIRSQFHAFSTLCAKHVFKTLQVSRNLKSGEIKGSLSGIEQLLFELARARTFECADSVIQKIRQLNPTVATYVEARRDQISAAGPLSNGFRRGGRITNQLAESFMNLSHQFRQQGHIGLIFGLNQYLLQRWDEEKRQLASWKSPNQLGVKVLSKRMSKQFEKEVLSKEGEYVVVKFLRILPRHVVGVVAKVSDRSDTRVVECFVDDYGNVTVLCPCLLHEEMGWPCGRVVRLLRTAEQMSNNQGHWDWTHARFFARFALSMTWEKQLQLQIVQLNLPKELRSREAALETFYSRVKSNNAFALLPAPIVGRAGRPKMKKKVKEHRRREKGVVDLSFSSQKQQERGKSAKLSETTVSVKDLVKQDVDDDDGDEGDDKINEEVNGAAFSNDSSSADDEDCWNDPGVEAMEDQLEIDDKGAISCNSHAHTTGSFELMPIPCLGDVFDEILGSAQRRVVMRQCSACGEQGHYAPACRKPQIEYILARLGVIPMMPSVLTLNDGLGQKVQGCVAGEVGFVEGHSLDRDSRPEPARFETMEIRANVPSDGDVEGSITHAGKHTRSGADATNTVCTICEIDDLGKNNWRIMGSRCASCDNFMHTKCIQSLQYGHCKLCPSCTPQKK